MQSVPVTTNVVSSNRAHGEVYSIQHYVIKLIKFVSDLRRVGGFLRVLRFPPLAYALFQLLTIGQEFLKKNFNRNLQLPNVLYLWLFRCEVDILDIDILIFDIL